MWSAALDPCVLTIRFAKPAGEDSRLFDPRSSTVRTVSSPISEHMLIDRGGEVIRLDVMKGFPVALPVMLRFDLADDNRVDGQLAAICALRAAKPIERRHVRLARRLLALQAADARDAGISLREIADMLVGPGDWPGDGEHRKSHVRRLIVTGQRMIQAGPRTILSGRDRYSAIGCTRSAGIASID